MQRTAKNVWLAGMAAVVVMVGLPVNEASADGGESIVGHCVAFTDADPTLTNNQSDGYIAVVAEMLTSAHLPDPNAEVDCKIQQLNGPDAPNTEIDVKADATGLVRDQQQISFDDQNGTIPVLLCERDTWGDGDTSGWVCEPFTPARTPPQSVNDVIALVGAVLDTVFATVICPTLKQLHLGGCT